MTKKMMVEIKTVEGFEALHLSQDEPLTHRIIAEAFEPALARISSQYLFVGQPRFGYENVGGTLIAGIFFDHAADIAEDLANHGAPK